ncbi:MAG: DUF559 domain-containing protein [Sphingomicrobium sp.]
MLLRKRAKSMRSVPTPAEHRLWQILRAKRFAGFKFKRQLPLDFYIVGFICIAQRLIIEVDGGQHSGNAYDERRDAYLKAQGFRILRFWNHDIFTNEEAVTETIFRALDDPSPSQACGSGPSLSRSGERGITGDTHG